ncbi:hypothetical protein VOLCADRAFT_103905 [Volvox carteri f. nagariensis]|uniref:Prohibitin n=1 Tax=Volvox carteri f. nagariensis TaxID=3068 RepID=D8TQ05_VOLCA|nr:uncharacterized protein VOLCADRAFT_103905 [Volvox carteri f. nagariensis]EFJ50320.1 hypothetical protein VOLCADRAFT_103905 [Volvox carteri f. nagariensis]|eukprot:XP_002948445.1 hypothetical protein VOLCADRAFT_103905 [Volvox carteri f. nagariensis]
MKAQPYQCIEDLTGKDIKKPAPNKELPLSPRQIAILIFSVLLLIAILIGQPIVSIPAGHLAVVDFFGYVPKNTISAGLHVKTLYSTIHSFSLKTQLMELTLNVPTNEGLIVELDVSILHRIHPNMVRDLYLTVGNNYKEVVLLPEVTSTVRSLTASVSSKTLYSASRDELSTNIKDHLNGKLAVRGIEIEQALLRKVVLPKLVTTAIEQKLMAEQDSQRMEFVLMKERQEAERKRIEAQGISDFQSIVSQGISDALLEWKGIEATERLANSANAKIVVVGNSKNGLPLILGEGSHTLSGKTATPGETKAEAGKPEGAA